MRPMFLDAIAQRVLVGDGAMGTQLIAQGLVMGSSAEEWNLSQPDRIRGIHQAYVDAGCDLLLTNTFGGNPLALARHGLAERAYEINLTAARIARDCIGPRGYVLGDVGPFGGFLQPLGNTTRSELEDAARVQIAALADGGVDAIIFETMTALEELAVVFQAARRQARRLPIIGSFTFDRLADGGFRTMTGVSAKDAVEFLVRSDVDAVGCNCGTGIHAGDYVELVAEVRRHCNRPIVVQPNAGQPRLDRGRIVYDETPAMMAAVVPDLVRAGASVVGGCCGTTPEHVRMFRKQVDALRPSGSARPGKT